jgi:hypothetical protein
MIFAILIVIAAVLSLVVIVRIAASRNLQISVDSGTELQPLDIDAFQNLIDPCEAEYLRSHLPASEFRRIQRLRLRAMAAYIQVVGRNAALLVHVGQLALRSTDANTSEAARCLVDQALLLRRNAAFALLRIYLMLPWPNATFAAAPIVDGYQRLNGSAMLLGRLQNPTASVRLSVL